LKVGWHTVIVAKAGVYINKTIANYINWEGDDDYLYFNMQRIEFTIQTLTLPTITPNPDPTGDIDLSWNNIEHEAGYKIYRGSNPGNLELVATVGADVTSHMDVGVAGGTWYYQIVAYNSTGSTVPSNIESVEVYSAGGAIPGFEGIFIVLAIVFLGTILRRSKTKDEPIFLKTFNN